MKWISGQPTEADYYLCAVVGDNKPTELYWDGYSWQNNNGKTIYPNEVPYYMRLDDIPMPEGW